MIKIRVNGKDYSFFESATATKQLDAGAGTFQFTAVRTKKLSFPIRIGDACEIFADDNKIITGFVETNKGSFGPDNHTITISGRDKTADFIDSTIDVITLVPPISLKKAIELIIEQIGAKIKVVENVKTDDFKSAEDLPSATVGEGAFEFALKLAKKKQVLLNVNGNGNLVIDRPTGSLVKAQIRHREGDKGNNIISGSWDYDNTKRFSKYKSVSQLNMVAAEFAGDISPLDLVTQDSGFIIDKGIRASRQLVFQAENSSAQQAASARTEWEANVRKTRGKIYTCVANSFYIDGIFMKPNLRIPIICDFAEIDDVMLLNSVQYSYSGGDNGGTQTLMSFVDKNAYKVNIEEPSKVGNAFVAEEFSEAG